MRTEAEQLPRAVRKAGREPGHEMPAVPWDPARAGRTWDCGPVPSSENSVHRLRAARMRAQRTDGHRAPRLRGHHAGTGRHGRTPGRRPGPPRSRRPEARCEAGRPIPERSRTGYGPGTSPSPRRSVPPGRTGRSSRTVPTSGNWSPSHRAHPVPRPAAQRTLRRAPASAY